jgi:hypothetical protein
MEPTGRAIEILLDVNDQLAQGNELESARASSAGSP